MRVFGLDPVMVTVDDSLERFAFPSQKSIVYTPGYKFRSPDMEASEKARAGTEKIMVVESPTNKSVMHVCVCVCVRVRVCVCACARVCMRARVCGCG